MPCMDGIESTRRLREYEIDENILPEDRQMIIGMSGNDERFLRQQGFNMDTFLAKPFPVTKFLETCSDLMNPHFNQIVLLVDDSFVIQKTTTKMLVNEGFTVEIAENGAKALDLMKLKKYYAVLMDFHMPVMDGVEATKRLREYETVENVLHDNRQFVIGTSGNDESTAREQGFNMDAFLAKPFLISQFLSTCSIFYVSK